MMLTVSNLYVHQYHKKIHLFKNAAKLPLSELSIISADGTTKEIIYCNAYQ